MLAAARKYLAAFALGGLAVLAMPPVGFFPVLFLTIPVWLHMTSLAKSARAAFFIGWAFGCGYFMVGFSWFDIAFETFFQQVLWFKPFVMAIIPAYVALYYAMASFIAWYFRSYKTYPLIFAVLLFWAEYLRGHYVSDFPWIILGYGWHHVLPVLQTASWFGIYGLTLMTLFWASSLYYKKIPAVSILSFFVALGWGSVYLAQHATDLTQTHIRIVQPNILQSEKQDINLKDVTFDKMIALTSKPSGMPIDYVVWPETSFDLMPDNSNLYLGKIAAALPNGSIGLVGVNNIHPADRTVTIYNSLIAVTPNAQIVATHNKFILAPWGEYIPYRSWVSNSPMGEMIRGMNDLTAGPGPSTVTIDGKPSFSPVICYESTFAGRMVDPQHRPDFLLFITNDAWSMASSPDLSFGPKQHFGMARVRTIEEGLPAIRSANTGISGVIDAHGRILETMGLNEAGILDVALPKSTAPTLYSKTRDFPLLCFAGLLLFLLPIYGFLSKKREK